MGVRCKERENKYMMKLFLYGNTSSKDKTEENNWKQIELFKRRTYQL